MINKIIWIVFAATLTLCAITSGYYWQRQQGGKIKAIIEKHQQEKADFEKKINDLQAERDRLVRQADSYKRELSALRIKRESIKVPASAAEIRKRFKELGYETTN